MKLFYPLIAIILLFFTIQSYSQHSKLSFATHWLPQAQFTGYYVAKDQGFFEEMGLDVEILHATASINNLEYLADGKADVISLFLITAISENEKGNNLINIAQTSQKSGILFITQDKNIKTIEDFEGKKIGIWRSGFEEVPQALLNEKNVTAEWIPILSSVNLFLMGGIDIMTVMWYNEYNQVYLSGVNKDEMNTFFLSDFGYNIPEDGLYVTEQTYKTRKDDLEKFVEAVFKGWEYAANNKEYSLNLVMEIMKKHNIPSNTAHQKWMLDKIIELQNSDSKNNTKSHLLIEDFHKALEIIKEKSNNSDFNLEYSNFARPVFNLEE